MSPEVDCSIAQVSASIWFLNHLKSSHLYQTKKFSPVIPAGRLHLSNFSTTAFPAPKENYSYKTKWYTHTQRCCNTLVRKKMREVYIWQWSIYGNVKYVVSRSTRILSRLEMVDKCNSNGQHAVHFCLFTWSIWSIKYHTKQHLKVT